MKKFYLVLFLFIIAFARTNAQAPAIKWAQKVYGGLGIYQWGSVIYDLQPGKRNEIIVGGTDSLGITNWDSTLLTKTYRDRLFFSRLDSAGNKIWNFARPYTGGALTAVVSTSKGYAAAGYIHRNSYSNPKAYLVKINEDGTLDSEFTFNGSRDEAAYSIHRKVNNELIAAGFTTSSDGDFSGNHSTDGLSDGWVVRMDSTGQVTMKKCFGGTGNDTIFSIVSTMTGYLAAGSTTSSDGDLPGNRGASDGWVFHISTSGEVDWSANLGGSGEDKFHKIIPNSDGTFLLIGTSNSVDGSSTGNHGSTDVWAVKISGDGQIIWSKTYGGAAPDFGFSGVRTHDGGYLISAATFIKSGELSGTPGIGDGWIMKISGNGDELWQTVTGEPGMDMLFGVKYKDESTFIAGGLQIPYQQWGRPQGIVYSLGNSSHIKGTINAPVHLSGMMVTASKNGFSRSATPQNNFFGLDLELGSYNVSIQSSNPYYTITPASQAVNFAVYFDTAIVNFTVQPIPDKKDLSINIIPLSIPRPGFEQEYKIIYRNVGTTIIPSGDVMFVADSNLNFISANPAPATISGDTLRWDYSAFAPFDSATIQLKMRIDPPPVVNNGDTLRSYAFINPVADDQTPSDDTASLRQIVVGSYDPNDKRGSWGGYMPVQQVASSPYIDYVIRFQNTGTDTAFTVHVRDTLDARVDWSTFEMLSASHPYQLSLTGGNKLDWKFADILLVDSNRNEPASHGYIAYRIRTRNNLAAGDTIHNTASIYFDYNLPVVTNNAFTRIVNTSTTLPVTLVDFSAGYQQPDAVLFWQTASEEGFDRFEIERSTDALRFVKTGHVRSAGTGSGFYQFRENLTAHNSPHFYYRLKMVDFNGEFTYSKTQLVKKINSGQIDLVFSPNPVTGATGRLFINLPRTTDVMLQVTDLQGRIMQQQSRRLTGGYNSLLYDIAALPAGSYILSMKAGNENKATQFIVVR